MISKTKISKRIRRKTNPELVETIELAKKNNLMELAQKLSQPTKNQSKVNLEELNKLKENKIIVVGKVLGKGDIKTKKEIAALSFSESAEEKLKKANCKILTIKKDIKEDKDLKGVKII